MQKVKYGRVDRKAMDAAKQARNAYAREWRAKNRDKVRQYNENYWARKAERQTEQKRAACY